MQEAASEGARPRAATLSTSVPLARSGVVWHSVPRMIPRWSVLLFACFTTVGTFACGTDGTSSAAPPPDQVPASPTCPDGFTHDATLDACVEVLPPAECAPGTMPELGKTECQPVGWSTPCPEGFVRDATGFACVDRFAPRAACAGATREDLRTGACVPVGDCDGAFPPPDATLFVDDSGPTDATHFTTLKAATLVAKDGAVIAVEEGTYKEDIQLGAANMAVVGRCPAKVRFESPGGPRAGVFVKGVRGTRLRGVTVSGFRGGVLVEGGELLMEDSVVDGNNTLGVYLRFGSQMTMRRSKLSNTVAGDEVGSGIVVYDGSVLALEDAAVVDSYFRHATIDGKGSTLKAARTVFARMTKLVGASEEVGVAAEDGALVELSQSAVLDSIHQGVRVTGAGSNAVLRESVIRRTSGRVKESGGVGLFVSTKGTAQVLSSAVTDSQVLGVYAGKDSGVVAVENSSIIGVPKGTPVEFGRGAGAGDGGRLEMKNTAVIDCPQSGIGLQFASSGRLERVYVKGSRPIPESIGEYGGFGLLVEQGSTAEVLQSSFDGNALAGMTSAHESEVTADGVLIRGTRELETFNAGSAVQIAKSGRMTMTRSALVGNTGTTALVHSGGLLTMGSSTIHGAVLGVGDTFGHGVTVFADARIELDGVAIFDNPGVGLVSDGGQAAVRGGVFARNAVALHVQNGAAITQSDVPATDLGAGELRVSTTTRFVANATRVGTGEIALPAAPID